MICKYDRFSWAKRWLWGLPLMLAGCGLWAATGADEPPAPARSVLYTAAGAVRALTVGGDGRLWAATASGVLCWPLGSDLPRRWTVANGLPSNDIRAIAADSDGVLVATPQGVSHLRGTGEVTRSEPAPDGAEVRCLLTAGPERWVGTSRGLSTEASGAWRLREGGGAWRMAGDGVDAWAATDQGLIRLADGLAAGWPPGMMASTAGSVTGLAVTRRGIFLATSLGVWRWASGRWAVVPMPARSPASHVSALMSDPHGVLAGLYGDGVYRWTDRGWTRVPGLPAACAEVTALARTPLGLVIGTRTGDVWQEHAGLWQPLPVPLTLPSADINCLAAFGVSLWAGTFDGGLLRLHGGNVASITQANGLSGDAPRAMLAWQGRFYARQADGDLDSSSDGQNWGRAFDKASLPRQEVYAMAADDRRLLLGGWAGWSATDGQGWERHFHDPELAGQVVTAIAAQGDAVWIGTQKRGLLRYQDGRYTAFQEPQGLSDDWITCLAVRGGRLLAGTYTGGVLERHGERFLVRLRPGAYAVRAITFDPVGGQALAATPLGLYQEGDAGHWQLLSTRLTGGAETQAVLAAPSGVWVAGRTGLAYIARSNLADSTDAPTQSARR